MVEFLGCMTRNMDRHQQADLATFFCYSNHTREYRGVTTRGAWHLGERSSELRFIYIPMQFDSQYV
jgi:hypothetical protein